MDRFDVIREEMRRIHEVSGTMGSSIVKGKSQPQDRGYEEIEQPTPRGDGEHDPRQQAG